MPVEERPSLEERLRTYLEHTREHATRLSLPASAIAQSGRLRGALAVCLEEVLVASRMAPTPVALAKLTVETLRDTCDALYYPRWFVEEPAHLLSRSFVVPPRYDLVRLWVACHLKWFAGGTVESVAEHLATSTDSVKRLLAETGPAVDQLWLARFAPRLP